jgi:hypothetical protein
MIPPLPRPAGRLRASRKFLVMPGLVPGIHVSAATKKEAVDGRVKPGHDEFRC